MDFKVLGTLTVTDGGTPLSLGGPVQRRLLASLLIHAPAAVSIDVLTDDLWDDSPPATAVRTLHSHVARLRRALGQSSEAPVETIQTIDNHYRLAIERTQLDAWVFEDAVRSTAGDVPPRQASAELRRALALWRGPAYSEFADAAFAKPEIRRLDALREQAIDRAIAADLAQGEGAELIPELETLLVEHPFRESLWSALIVALYRSGRQGDALAAYQRARSVLGEELGVDPGPELRAVQARVLSHDPSLLSEGSAPARVPTCPWKGLAAYQPSDAEFYFGQDVGVNEALARLVDYPVVVITGASGSGKSSLVRAGVIPALAQGAIIGSAEWRIGMVGAGPDPLAGIARELERSPDLLVIDSADELAAGPPSTLRALGDLLGDALSAGVRVLMTVRGDLYGRLGEAGAAVIRSGIGTVLIGVPTDDELRRVVTLPAARAGLHVEPELVDAVIADVGGSPGCLPLMSTALVRTWERRDDGRLTLAAYRASGGAVSALERLAEESYDALSTDEKGAAEHLLVRLVTNDDGRWRARRLPLTAAAPADDPAARAALQRLAEARLVSIDGDGVQITHEALTVAWPRLADWLRERALLSSMVGHLTDSARAWEERRRDDAYLYRGTRLQSALELEASHPEEVGQVERAFIGASRAAAERELHQLRRGRRRLGYLAASLVVLLVVALVSGFLAMRSRDAAELAARASDAQRAGLQALGLSDTDQRLLLAVAAVHLHDDAGTRASLLSAIQGSASPDVTVQLAGVARGLAVSADGWIAVSEEGGLVEVLPPDLGWSRLNDPSAKWTAGTPSDHLTWLAGHDSLLVGARQPDQVFVMNPMAGQTYVLGREWDPGVFAATRDGSWAASPTSPGGITAVDLDALPTGIEVRVTSTPLQMAAGPDLTLLAIERTAVQVVDPADRRVRDSYPIPEWVAAGPTPDGTAVATVTADGDVTIVDLSAGRTLRPLPRIDPAPTVLALSDGADLLATSGGADGTIRVWSTSDGWEVARFTPAVTPVSHMAWSPTDGRLVTASSGQALLQLWDLGQYIDLTRAITPSAPAGSGQTTATDVDAQARLLAVGTDSGRPWFVDLDTGRVHASSQGVGASIVSIGLADGGRVAVVADALGGLSTWDPRTGMPIADLIRPNRPIENTGLGRAAVAPDGRRVATSVDGFDLRMIDVVDGTRGDPLYVDIDEGPVLMRVLSWTPDGSHVVVGTQRLSMVLEGYQPTEPGEWALVDPATGEIDWITPAPEVTVPTEAAFIDDGRVIVVPGRSGRLYFLDSETGRLLDSETSAPEAITSVGTRPAPTSLAQTPDGGLLAVVSRSHPVEVWDTRAGTPTAVINVSSDTSRAHFVSPEELVTVTSGGAVRLHDLSVPSWVRAACSAAGRELTEAEWAHFLRDQPYQRVCDGSAT